MKTVFLTGATGFAGRCIIDHILKNTDWDILAVSREHIRWASPRMTCVTWDFKRKLGPDFQAVPFIDYIIHAGAEVHALRSLKEPLAFFETNIMGTANVLELARVVRPELFVYISSAEVLGGKEEGYSHEDDRLRPSNPYSASKAAGELLTYSYFRSFDLPAIIVRTMNLIGESQTDESKFVPMVKKCLQEGKRVPIHVRNGKPGSRQWIDGGSFAAQLVDLLSNAELGETYHIVGEELTNLEMAQRVADEMKVPLEVDLQRISKTHEWRYAIQRTR